MVTIRRAVPEDAEAYVRLRSAVLLESALMLIWRRATAS